MDRLLPPKTKKNIQRNKFLRIASVILLVFAAGYYALSLLTLSAERKLLRIEKVSMGEVEASINASGTVVPAFEQTLTSPIDTRIMKVFHWSGDTLHPSDPVMMLDVDFVRISIRKTYDQLALKANALAQLRASFKGQLALLKSQTDNWQLEVNQQARQLSQQERLFNEGVITENDYQLSKTAYQKAVNEFKATEASLQNLRTTTVLQEEGLQLEINILKGELEILENQLSQANMRAGREGILTWVLSTEGASVQRGAVLAKIADLSSYRVDAKVSEIHIASITIGMQAKVKVSRAKGGETILSGEVSNISPTIENGIAQLQLRLHEPDHPALRPNQRVEVYLISSAKENTLRLPNPTFIMQSGSPELFVVQGDKAVKRKLETGLRGGNWVEIISGLEEGEAVILSNMESYAHANSISLE